MAGGKSKSHNQAFGKWGEAKAADYLKDKGYIILEMNYRTPYGEIDLIALDQQTVVFVEVKTRRTQTFGFPEDSVNSAKRTHMVNSAQVYMQTVGEMDWRIDVIAVSIRETNQPPEIIHFENAIYD